MKRRLLFLSGISLAVVLCMLMPFGVFQTASEDFQVLDRTILLCYTLALALVVCSLLLLMLLAVGKRFPHCFRYACAFVFALAVMLYAQGNLIGLDYGILDGRPIDWDGFRVGGMINSILWAVVVIAGTLAFARLIRRNIEAAVLSEFCFCCYALIIFVCCFVCSPDCKEKPAHMDDGNLLEVSSDRNLIVFVLDSFDRALFDLALERHPEIRQTMSGFTYFHNTMGRFTSTAMSLPQLICGHVPDPAEGCQDYRDQCYSDAPFLKSAKNHGFEVDLYADVSIAPRANVARSLGCFGNAEMEETPFWSARNFGILRSLMRVSFFKYLPHFLKPAYFRYLMRRGFGCANEDGEDADVRTERLLGERLGMDAPFEIVPGRKVKIYHLHGVHVPNFNLERAVDTLDLVSRYRAAMSTAGLLERTAFIVLADHGVLNRAHPMFLAGNSSGRFEEDPRPVSYRRMGDIWSSGLIGNVIEVPEATAAEMHPSATDRTVFRKDFIEFEATEFNGRRLELIRLSPNLDTVGDQETERISWNGQEGFLAIPIAPSIRSRPVVATFSFESPAQALSYAKAAPLAFADHHSPQNVEVQGSSMVVPIPETAIDHTGAFVRIYLARWPGGGPPPSIVSVAMNPL